MPEEKTGDRKFSQEEAKLLSLAKRFLRQISVATKNFRMFGESHPFLKNNVNNACELLRSMLLMKDNITLTFIEGACLIEDLQLKNLDLKTYSFLTTAKELGITSLTFTSGISDTELHAILKIISDGPNALRNAGGLSGFVQSANLPHIKADEIFFKKVSKKEEESREAKKHLDDFLIINYLMGKSAMSKDDIAAMAGEISIDPKRMGKILSDAALSGNSGGGPGTQGLGPEDCSSPGMEFAKSGIEKIAVNIKNVHGKSYDDIKKEIGSLIMSLEPPVRRCVIGSKMPISGVSDDFIGDILREISDDIVVDLIISDIVGKKFSVVRVKKLIERLLPDKGKRERLFPVLEERLIKAGVPQDARSKILEEKFWIDMSIDEKVRQIISERPFFSIETGISDEIYKLAEELLAANKPDALKSVIKKVLENLELKDSGIKIRFLRDFKKIYMMLLQSKEYPDKEDLVNSIRSECNSQSDPDIKERCLGILSDSITACVQNKMYAHIPPLLNSVGYENVKTKMTGNIKIADLLKDMLRSPSLDRRYVEDIAKEIGPEAKSALCEMLMSIVNEDFESYKERLNITLILKNLGEDTEAIFIKELASENTGMLKNALEALSEIGTERSVAPIEKLRMHQNSDIRTRADLALKRINKRA